jgi:hypothetical protein
MILGPMQRLMVIYFDDAESVLRLNRCIRHLIEGDFILQASALYC